MGRRHRKPPQDQPRVAVGDRAGHPERADDQLSDEVIDEVLAERPAAQGHDEKRRPPNLKEQVADDERTGSRSGSSQFAPHAVMYQAWTTASVMITVSAIAVSRAPGPSAL